MLEKNKDYVEFTLKCTTVDYEKNKSYAEVYLNGYSDADFYYAPMDVVCKEFDHKVVVVGKRDFDELQALATINAAIAKEWEKNYNLLLKKTGFDTVESLVFYLTNVGQSNTLLEALASLRDRAKYTCDEWKDLNRKLQECEKDYISERDKAEALEKENEELKKKLQVPDPFAEYKELINSLKNKAKFTESNWQKATGHDTPGAAEHEIETLKTALRESNLAMLKELENNIDEWQIATGCDAPEKAQCKITDLYNRIDKMKEAASIASNWTDKIVEG